jgi:hypothetical protein
VDDEVHIPLQNSVHGPSVSLLDVDLALVAARLEIELRVPRVSQVRIRDVGDPYDLIPLFNPTLFRSKHMAALPEPQARVWCLAISDRTSGSRSFGISTKGLIPILECSFVFGGRLIVFLSDGVAGRLPEAYPNFMKRASAAFYS